ncbi:hypothetical protein WAI453_001707 [Rhynchosporium graminicola]
MKRWHASSRAVPQRSRPSLDVKLPIPQLRRIAGSEVADLVQIPFEMATSSPEQFNSSRLLVVWLDAFDDRSVRIA